MSKSPGSYLGLCGVFQATYCVMQKNPEVLLKISRKLNYANVIIRLI